jgi:undecaprenyl-diphosphatase
MIAITELGDAVVTTSVTTLVFLWLAWRRLWRTALYWAAAIGLAAAINTGIKAIVHRAPPEDLLYSGWSAFSFPSGHSTVNAVMYGFLAFLIGCNLRPAWRIPLFAAAFSWSALIAFSRLYLGVDWFSDVVGSLAFATAWVIVLAIAHVQHAGAHRRADTKGLATAAVAALVLAGGLNIWQRHATDVARYAVRYEVPSVTASAWWHADWQLLPAWRIDLTGELEEPLTFQWAGDLQRLDRELAQKGWHPPARWTIANALLWLMANPDPLTLPVVPYPNGGRMPRLTLVHADPDAVGQPASRLVLRLWASDLHLRDGAARRLWSGSVVRERLYRPLSLITLSLAQPDANEARAVLATALDNDRLVRRQPQASQGNWDGQVLLAHDADIPVGEVHEGQSGR